MATGDEVLVSLKGKTYKLEKSDLPKLHKKIGGTWQKTIRNYTKQMESVHAVWKTHSQMREEYFFTARILQSVTSAYFPTEADLAKADKEIQNLKTAAAAGNLDGIEKANEAAGKWTGNVSKLMDNYTKAMCASSTDLVAGAQFIRDSAKDGVDILSQIVLAKAPGGAAAAAAVSGGYNELLNQIEAAQAPDAPNIVVAASMVVNAAALDALVKKSMEEFKIAEKIYDKIKDPAKKILGKYLKDEEIKTFIEHIWKEQIKTAIESTLKEGLKVFRPGTKFTLEGALQNIFDDVLKKTTALQVFGKIPVQITKAQGLVLDSIKKGAIKGVKLEGKALEEQVKKLIENSIEKMLEKAIAGTGAKIDNLANALHDEIIKDSKFKADVSKAAGKKT